MVVSETNIHSIHYITLLFLFNNVSLTTIFHIFFSFMSLIYCCTTAGIAWLPQQHKVLEQTCISYNEVCNFYHSSRSWKYRDFFTKTKTFPSRPRLIFQDQDHFLCPQGISRPRSRDYIPGTSTTGSQTWKSCASVSRRNGTIWTRKWLTTRSVNGASDWQPALQLAEDILNIHSEHYCIFSHTE